MRSRMTMAEGPNSGDSTDAKGGRRPLAMHPEKSNMLNNIRDSLKHLQIQSLSKFSKSTPDLSQRLQQEDCKKKDYNANAMELIKQSLQGNEVDGLSRNGFQANGFVKRTKELLQQRGEESNNRVATNRGPFKVPPPDATAQTPQTMPGQSRDKTPPPPLPPRMRPLPPPPSPPPPIPPPTYKANRRHSPVVDTLSVVSSATGSGCSTPYVHTQPYLQQYVYPQVHHPQAANGLVEYANGHQYIMMPADTSPLSSNSPSPAPTPNPMGQLPYGQVRPLVRQPTAAMPAWGIRQRGIPTQTAISRHVNRPPLYRATAPEEAEFNHSGPPTPDNGLPTSARYVVNMTQPNSCIKSVQVEFLGVNGQPPVGCGAVPSRQVNINYHNPNVNGHFVPPPGAVHQWGPLPAGFLEPPGRQHLSPSPISVISSRSTHSTNSTENMVQRRPPPPYPGAVPGAAPSRGVPAPPVARPAPEPPRTIQVSPQSNAAPPYSLPPTVLPSQSSAPHSFHPICVPLTSDVDQASDSLSSATNDSANNRLADFDGNSDTDLGGRHICTSPKPERRKEDEKRDEERLEVKARQYSSEAYKFYMEQHVENLLKSVQQRELRRHQLEEELRKFKPDVDDTMKEVIRKIYFQKESNYNRLKRAKLDKNMFKHIKTIGVGAFGEVTLVKKKDPTHRLFAMKTLKKIDVLQRNQVAHVKAERDILAEADCEWVVKLYYSFQDKDNLYFIMDYIPGGDMMTLLINLQIFDEALARFYIAELVLAIESVHNMGFIHRDIKPDNILIDRNGHIKLSDFGLCTGFRWTHNSKYYQKGNHARQDSMEPWIHDDVPASHNCDSATRREIVKPLQRRQQQHKRNLAISLVGTPNYIAPEVLMRTGYTKVCDFWSVGVIMYEMLVGSPPFLAETPQETQQKVINWPSYLYFPSESGLSEEAKDLILLLLKNAECRLGVGGPEEIKKHPFFHSIRFEGLRGQPAPRRPTLQGLYDTSNFEHIDEDQLRTAAKSKGAIETEKYPVHGFFEFTFKRFFDESGLALPLPSSHYSDGRAEFV